jgi:hypothetical protein
MLVGWSTSDFSCSSSIIIIINLCTGTPRVSSTLQTSRMERTRLMCRDLKRTSEGEPAGSKSRSSAPNPRVQAGADALTVAATVLQQQQQQQ